MFDLDAGRPPVAALGYFADFSEPPPGVCFRLDPVHLRADTSGLVLLTAESVGLSEKESRALFEAVRPRVEEDGWIMRYGAADRWYVSSTRSVPVPLTQSPKRVAGQPVSTCLPVGEGTDDWLRRINECQMLLHAHEVNRSRASHGSPLISGLWLWGGGVMPASGKAACSHIQTTRSALSGLAGLHGVSQCSGITGTGSLPSDDSVLLVDLDACEPMAASGDVQHWCVLLEQLERDWFRPLLEGLMRGKFRQLELLPLDGFRYPLRRGDLMAFWRRRRNYRSLAE